MGVELTDAGLRAVKLLALSLDDNQLIQYQSTVSYHSMFIPVKK